MRAFYYSVPNTHKSKACLPFFAAAIGMFFLYPILLRGVFMFFPDYSWYLQSRWGNAATPRFYLIIAAIELLVTVLTMAYVDHQSYSRAVT